MIRMLLLILTSSFIFTLNAQNLMTIREVFDFQIGDEYQYSTTGTNVPTNADRVSIIGKYYSPGNDSLFYIRYHDSFYSVWNGSPPLEYHFWTKTDTAVCSNLDLSIASFDTGFQTNQYIRYSSQLCDSLINGYGYSIGPMGEARDSISHEYGKGLGSTNSYFESAQGNYYLADKLFYYKKGGITCGSPNLTNVGIDVLPVQKSEFSIFPNPAQSIVYLKNESQNDQFQCKLIDPIGKSIMSLHLNGKINGINMGHLKQGIYLLQINSDNRLTTIKVIKE